MIITNIIHPVETLQEARREREGMRGELEAGKIESESMGKGGEQKKHEDSKAQFYLEQACVWVCVSAAQPN